MIYNIFNYACIYEYRTSIRSMEKFSRIQEIKIDPFSNRPFICRRKISQNSENKTY